MKRSQVTWQPNTDNKKIEDFDSGTLVRLKNGEIVLLGDMEAGSDLVGGCGCCAVPADSPVVEFSIILED